jgi:SPP1 gp7 family putative phage head morphogenesis protein
MQRLGELAAEWLKNKSFTIAGDLKASAVKEIKQSLLSGLKQSKSARDIKLDIYDRLTRKGVISGRGVREAVRSGELGFLEDQLALEGLEPYHLDTVIRTNMFEAINEARFNAFTDPVLEGFVTGFEYSAILDSRTTEVCEHMNGRAYTIAQWEGELRPWVPPNHFNCRSLLVPITVNDEAEMTEDMPSVEPQEGFG